MLASNRTGADTAAPPGTHRDGDFADGHYDDKLDYFDYDDPGDFDSCPSVYGFVGPDDYELYHDLQGLDDCGVYCVSLGDVGVVPYWSGDEEGDVYEGDVALPRTGSDEPVDMLGYSVVSTFGPGGPGGPCDEEGDIYEGDVAMPRTGSDELVNSVVSTIGRGGPCDETGSVADTPGDAIVVSSEFQEIDRRTLDNIRMWWVNPRSESKGVFAFDLCVSWTVCG